MDELKLNQDIQIENRAKKKSNLDRVQKEKRIIKNLNHQVRIPLEIVSTMIKSLRKIIRNKKDLKVLTTERTKKKMRDHSAKKTIVVKNPLLIERNLPQDLKNLAM
jgi:hypothetical protein